MNPANQNSRARIQMRKWELLQQMPQITEIRSCVLAAAIFFQLQTSVEADECDWAAIKLVIDEVLDLDKVRSAEFKRLAAMGRDSLTAVRSLLPELARGKLDDCNYQAGEYLTQRGFPPLH